MLCVYYILDMNRTLLVEEGDDEGNNRQDKKKREKEKFPDAAGTLRLSVNLNCFGNFKNYIKQAQQVNLLAFCLA